MNIQTKLKRIEEQVGLGGHQWPHVSAFLNRTAGREMLPEEDAELSRMLVMDPKLSAFLDSLAEV